MLTPNQNYGFAATIKAAGYGVGIPDEDFLTLCNAAWAQTKQANAGVPTPEEAQAISSVITPDDLMSLDKVLGLLMQLFQQYQAGVGQQAAMAQQAPAAPTAQPGMQPGMAPAAPPMGSVPMAQPKMAQDDRSMLGTGMGALGGMGIGYGLMGDPMRQQFHNFLTGPQVAGKSSISQPTHAMTNTAVDVAPGGTPQNVPKPKTSPPADGPKPAGKGSISGTKNPGIPDARLQPVSNSAAYAPRSGTSNAPQTPTNLKPEQIVDAPTSKPKAPGMSGIDKMKGLGGRAMRALKPLGILGASGLLGGYIGG